MDVSETLPSDCREDAETKTGTEAKARPPVSDGDFDGIVRGALEAVGGILLFKMRVGEVEAGQHVAAASVGAGSTRQFLLLSLPASGGRLKVEPTTHSQSPLARLAESYAGLMDVFKAAA